MDEEMVSTAGNSSGRKPYFPGLKLWAGRGFGCRIDRPDENKSSECSGSLLQSEQGQSYMSGFIIAVNIPLFRQ